MTNVDKDPVIEMCRAIEDYFGDADRTFPEAIALLVSAARERDQLVSAGSEPNLIAAGGTPPNGYFIRGSDAEGWSVALTIAGPEIWKRRRAAVSEAHAHAVRGGARLEQEREEQRTKRLYKLLDVMVQRWPNGSTDDIKDLARILGVELWTRTLPSPGSGEMRWSTADAGKDFDQTDTDGWTQVEVGQ